MNVYIYGCGNMDMHTYIIWQYGCVCVPTDIAIWMCVYIYMDMIIWMCLCIYLYQLSQLKGITFEIACVKEN